MTRSIILSLVLALFLLFVISCSGNGGGNVTAPAPDHNPLVNNTSGMLMQGMWQFTAHADGTLDMVQLRTADKIINVLGFMEPPPLTLMNLDWDNLVIDFDNGLIDVGVILTHPIPGDDVFTGFDVRGVCFGPRVSNADGLTIIPSPEFFTGVPFGYQDGLLGATDSFANYEGLAGYKYFCDGLGEDDDLATFFTDSDNLTNRGSYGAGATNQRNYNLEWNSVSQNFLVFNYAIYANYNWPVGDAPIDLEDFDITTANSAEAFCASATVTNGGFFYSGGVGGGSISMQVEIWDWQGDITNVTLESPALGMTETPYTTYVGAGSTAYSNIWEFDSVAGTPTSTGEVDLILRAYDVTTFGNAWFMDLLPPSNLMYDEQVFNAFPITVEVVANSNPIVDGVYLTGASGCGYEFYADATDNEDATVDLTFWWSVEVTGNPAVYDDDSGVTVGNTNTIVLNMPGVGSYTVDLMVEDTALGQGFATTTHVATYDVGFRFVENPLITGQLPIDIGVDPLTTGNVYVLGEIPPDTAANSSVTVWSKNLVHQSTYSNIGANVIPTLAPSALDVGSQYYFTIAWPEYNPPTLLQSHDHNYNKTNGTTTGIGRNWVAELYVYDVFNNGTVSDTTYFGNTAGFADYPAFSAGLGLATYYHCGVSGVTQGALWQGGYPGYQFSGPNAVLFPPNVPMNRVDAGTTTDNAYIIEGTPENTVEAWITWNGAWYNYNMPGSSDMIANHSFGTVEPLDVTVDSDGTVIVLGNDGLLYFFDADLTPQTPASIDISGCVTAPIAIDADLDTDEVYVLSSGGITIVVTE